MSAVSEMGELAAGGGRPVRVVGEALRRSLYYTTLAWVFGAFWQAATSGAITTPLARYLGATDFQLAALGAAGFVGFLMQIPGSMITARLGRRKGVFIWWLTIHRLLYIVIGLMPWFMPAQKTGSAWLLVGALLVSMLAANVGSQAWVNWMADLVPPRVRGKYFARRSRIGIGVMAATTISVGVLLDVGESGGLRSGLEWVSGATGTRELTEWSGLPALQLMISAILVIAGVLGTMDIQCFHRVDEPAMRRMPRQSFWGMMVGAWRDRPFRRYVTYASVLAFANGWTGWLWWAFFLDFCEKERKAGAVHWWLPHQFVVGCLILGTAYNLGQFAGFPMWGAMIDRFGRKPVIFLSSTLHTLSWCAWPFLSARTLPWLLPVQLYGGLVGAGQDVANFNMMLDFNRKGGPGYQALASVITNTVAACAGLTAGWLATWIGGGLDGTPVSVVVGRWSVSFNHFALVAMIGCAAKFFADLVVLPHVTDVEAKPTEHALRFMLGNMYGNLNTLIFVPLSRPLQTLQAMNPVTNERLRPWNWGRRE